MRQQIESVQSLANCNKQALSIENDRVRELEKQLRAKEKAEKNMKAEMEELRKNADKYKSRLNEEAHKLRVKERAEFQLRAIIGQLQDEVQKHNQEPDALLEAKINFERAKMVHKKSAPKYVQAYESALSEKVAVLERKVQFKRQTELREKATLNNLLGKVQILEGQRQADKSKWRKAFADQDQAQREMQQEISGLKEKVQVCNEQHAMYKTNEQTGKENKTPRAALSSPMQQPNGNNYAKERYNHSYASRKPLAEQHERTEERPRYERYTPIIGQQYAYQGRTNHYERAGRY